VLSSNTENLCLEDREINQIYRIKLSLLTDSFAKISSIVVVYHSFEYVSQCWSPEHRSVILLFNNRQFKSDRNELNFVVHLYKYKRLSKKIIKVVRLKSLCLMQGKLHLYLYFFTRIYLFFSILLKCDILKIEGHFPWLFTNPMTNHSLHSMCDHTECH